MEICEKKYDARCILLCKTYQHSYKHYENISKTLRRNLGKSLSQYISLGEYDHLFSFELNGTGNILHKISNCNNFLSKTITDAFYKPLYIFTPFYASQDISKSNKFWKSKNLFLFLTTIHVNNCSADYSVKSSERDQIVKTIEEVRDSLNAKFEFAVYYSFDLSEFIILWKTSEPYEILSTIQNLYKKLEIIGYTNTLCAVPPEQDALMDRIGTHSVSMSVQAVAKSYYDALQIHNAIIENLEKSYDINRDEKKPEFSLGNYDYTCKFSDVLPKAFLQLHYLVYADDSFKNKVVSINVAISKGNAYSEKTTDEYMRENHQICDETICTQKKGLIQTCYGLKDGFFSFFKKHERILDRVSWRKPLSELLVLLETMGNSAIFDTVCFLFLDSAHLFLAFLNYLADVSKTESGLEILLGDQELFIEKFVREWEQLSEQVVRIDGIYQRTPGYEFLNHNIPVSIVEYHNAFANMLIDYFLDFDIESNSSLKKTPSFSCFVVPKMCRNFKTAQWFCGDRSKSSLLFVTVPILQLYQPSITMLSLTHEISHYCANSIRMRKTRTEMIISSTASLLCERLKIASLSTKKECFSLLKQLFIDSNDKMQKDWRDLYLNEISQSIKKAVSILLNNSSLLQRLHSSFCSEHEMDESTKKEVAVKIRRRSIEILSILSDDVSMHHCDSIYAQIDDIVSLFKEGYADLMMIHVLSLSKNDYLNAVFYDSSLLQKDRDAAKIRMKFQRAMIVCEAACFTKSDYDTSPKDATSIELIRIFEQEYCEWQKGNEVEKNWKFYYSRDVLTSAILYLKSCSDKVKSLEEKMSLSSKRQAIVQSYSNMVDRNGNGFFSENYQSVIQNNRNKIIGRWNDCKQDTFSF